MAAGGPTRALLQKIRVVDVSNENVPGYFLLLEMALYAERRVAFVQQALVDGAVGRMANSAPLPHRLVLIHKWAALLCVTLETGFVSGHKSKAAGSELLLNICRGALGRDPFVWLMAIAAAHLAFQHRMMMRQLKRCANVQVTLETGVRRLSWIDDRARSPAGLNVQTPGTVTRFAAHVLCVFSFCLQPGVSGCSEIAHDLFVAGRALLRANKLGARDAGRGENCSIGSAARQQNDGERDRSPSTPQQGFAPTVDPSSYSRTPHESRVCAEIKNDFYAFFQVFSWPIGILPTPPNQTLGSTELRWRFPTEFLKHAIELRQRLKSRCERDLADPPIAVM
jgi:hypothetical protein